MTPNSPPETTIIGPLDQLARPLRDLRVSVTDRCNFRCPYCMPAEVFGERYEFLPKPEILTFEEITRTAAAFVALGTRKIRITGGEPLLRAQLPILIADLARIPNLDDLSLTTNGFLLGAVARELADAGLRRVTVSLDSLDPNIFARMSGGIREPSIVLDAIDAAERAGLAPVKINCVVQRGVNEPDIVALARHFRGTGHIVRYIEYMDVGTRNQWSDDAVVSEREIIEKIAAEFPLEVIPPNYEGEVARRYRYLDGAGEIGVIASVTRPFCGGCTRARLTTEGQLVTCLFAERGVDLKASLRDGTNDEALRARIAAIWTGRNDRYSELRGKGQPAARRIEMYQVGG
ncbi:MAG: cyclic pyranopterin phosphate synthase [Hyphomicrobiaceae bacterium]|jgi:cyclic pyranopterin phosphate synthase